MTSVAFSPEVKPVMDGTVVLTPVFYLAFGANLR